MRTFLVRCPKCSNSQKITIRKSSPLGSVKTCVYCGKRFTIHSNVNNSKIIREIKCIR